jgi:putative oxygen-independent coproporphyrinogen III oxidase
MTSSPGVPAPVSLYVHVPFCVSKCAYCDFFSVTDAPRIDEYVAAVLASIERPEIAVLVGDVPTLYFGGGTPTLLGAGLVKLVSGIRERAGLRADAEITVETNPETTDPDVLTALVDAGVNRFSLGVQAFDDGVLRVLGRAHNAARAAAACAALVRTGVPFSIDLMCGVPGQTIESWAATLERASMTGALHASVYPLSIEPGTPMRRSIVAGTVDTPDPDVAADMMEMACESMAYQGMDRYEVASYAYPGHESRHNTVYWTGGAYLGLGPGAASMLPVDAYRASGLIVPGVEIPEEPGGGRVRFALEKSVEGFADRGMGAMDAPGEYLSGAEAAREDVMLGLRLVRGVAAARVEAVGVTPVLERLASDGLTELHDGSWRTTDRGWLLGNRVFEAVWSGV